MFENYENQPKLFEFIMFLNDTNWRKYMHIML
jgi:hypothetical protein